MITDANGLTSTYLEDGEGNKLHIPYRIAAHGFVLSSPAADIALVILPVSAIEDPRFMLWLGKRGIYRIEDANGSRARIGEGRVLDRLRRHRANPMLLPGIVAAAFGLSVDWTFAQRRYLEARLAAGWVAEGNVLASRTFNWKILNGDQSSLEELDRSYSDIDRLLVIAGRILDNDADEFVPVLPNISDTVITPAQAATLDTSVMRTEEVRLRQVRHARHTRSFPRGCQLRYEDGLIAAIATARNDGLVLHPGSRVYRSAGPQAGRNFRKCHEEFLTQAGVTDEGEIGTTTLTVVADTAAFLIKNVTGGRVHVAARWQVMSS